MKNRQWKIILHFLVPIVLLGISTGIKIIVILPKFYGLGWAMKTIIKLPRNVVSS